MTLGIAFGQIRPAGSNYSLSKRTLNADGIRVEISISDSQVVALLDFRDLPVKHPFTIRNVVERTIQSQIDISSFVQGRGYLFEMNVIIIPGELMYEPQYSAPVLEDKLTDELEHEYWNKISIIYSTEHADDLRRVLKDFRIALQDANETGFACYRAVEAIRKHIGKLEEDNERSWETVHSVLGTSSSDFIKIAREHANERRHGGRQMLSDEEREWIFEITWDAIKKYIDNIYQRIDADISDYS